MLKSDSLSRLQPGFSTRFSTAAGILAFLFLLTACGAGRRSAREAVPVEFGEPRPPIGVRADPLAIALGDFDGDPLWREMLVIYAHEPWAEVLPNDLRGGWRNAGEALDLLALLPEATNLEIRQAQFLDFNSDRRPDLGLLNAADGKLYLLAGDADGGFQYIGALDPPVPEVRPVAFTAANFDRDDAIDFALATDSQAHFYFRQPPAFRYRLSPRPIEIGPAATAVIGGDLLVRNTSDFVVIGLEGVRMMRRTPSQMLVPDETHQIDLTDVGAALLKDVNGDALPDLLFARTPADQVQITLINVDREWVPNDPESIEVSRPTALALEDTTSDGLPDLLVGSARTPETPPQIHIFPQVRD